MFWHTSWFIKNSGWSGDRFSVQFPFFELLMVVSKYLCWKISFGKLVHLSIKLSGFCKIKYVNIRSWVETTESEEKLSQVKCQLPYDRNGWIVHLHCINVTSFKVYLILLLIVFYKIIVLKRIFRLVMIVDALLYYDTSLIILASNVSSMNNK